MQNSGIMARMKNFWLPDSINDQIEVTGFEYSISFEHMRLLVTTYLKALAISLGLLIIEIIVFEFNKKLNTI